MSRTFWRRSLLALVVPPLTWGLGAGAAHAEKADDLVVEARELSARGDLGGAESKLKLALEVDRNNAAANVEMGLLKLMRNELPMAQQFANMALAKDRNDAAALILLVRVMGAMGQIDVAVAKTQEAANTYRDNAGVQLAYGEALLEQGKPDQALLAATRALKLQETSIAAMKLLARGYMALARPVTAESVLIRALEIERDPEALCLLAGIRYGEGNLIEARLLLEEAVGKQPGYVEALNSLGAIYNVVRNWDSALDALNRVIAMAPSFPEAWLNLGSSQRGAGRFDQAEASWKKVLTLAPKMADAWYNLGILYLENPIGTRDRIQQLTDSINAFNAFKRGATGNDPNVDKFIEEARLLIKQEQDRRNEQLKGTPPEDGKGKPPADGEGGLK